MQEIVNIAVIGAGFWGKKVIEEYLRLMKRDSRVNLSMVADLQVENLQYCKTILGISKDNLTRDYKTILHSDEISAVHICTPIETHYPLCREILNSGKHVLLEKPMALRIREALELKELAESRNLILKVGHIYRFNNAVSKARELLEQGYLGDIYNLKLQWTTIMPSPQNIGVIYDLAPHAIDIVNELLDQWPIRITCKGKACRRKSYEEFAYIIMEFEEHLLAHIELSWLLPGKTRQVIICGSERSAEIDCLNQSIKIYDNSKGETFNIELTRNNTIFDEIRNFIDCTIVGRILQDMMVKTSKFNNDASEGVKNVTVLDNSMRSLIEDKTIKINWKEILLERTI